MHCADMHSTLLVNCRNCHFPSKSDQFARHFSTSPAALFALRTCIRVDLGLGDFYVLNRGDFCQPKARNFSASNFHLISRSIRRGAEAKKEGRKRQFSCQKLKRKLANYDILWLVPMHRGEVEPIRPGCVSWLPDLQLPFQPWCLLAARFTTAIPARMPLGCQIYYCHLGQKSPLPIDLALNYESLSNTVPSEVSYCDRPPHLQALCLLNIFSHTISYLSASCMSLWRCLKDKTLCVEKNHWVYQLVMPVTSDIDQKCRSNRREEESVIGNRWHFLFSHFFLLSYRFLWEKILKCHLVEN